jgi:hypothetical protein
MTDLIAERLLVDCIIESSLDGRKAARRALERYLGGGDITPASSPVPARYQRVERREWYEDLRRDGTVKRRGGSTTIVHTTEW